MSKTLTTNAGILQDDEIRPATRDEVAPMAVGSVVLAFVALLYSSTHGFLLLFGDAVAHLHIARRILDSRNPGFSQLGGVWLPLPHLLLLPFVQRMDWWQNGLAGAWLSMACYVLSVAGLYKITRYILPLRWALVSTIFFALNPGLLYLSSTAMTEPLFLVLVIWSVLLLMECAQAAAQNQVGRAVRKLLFGDVLLIAAVYTRYDGWIIGTIAWCIVLVIFLRHRALWRSSFAPAFVAFTLLLLAAPLGWLAYNAHYFHDPLDFMRGPYSAKAIELRTTPPGSAFYPGYHNVFMSALYYSKVSQLDAAVGHGGAVVMLLALIGLVLLLRKRRADWFVLALLWVPLPFYIYSVAYGYVPIFFPQWSPYAFYNTRYGMEMLPAFAIFMGLALFWMEKKFPQIKKYLLPVVAVLIAASTAWQVYAKPLVLQEALANSRTRIPFESALATQLEMLPPGVPILMYNSDHVGALQMAGIPLKQTLNEFDYDSWRNALDAPAKQAAYVVAIAGDPVAAAVKAHPGGLTEMAVICTSGQPCARVYSSEEYRGQNTSRNQPQTSH
ncbi:MAG: hypothetical protein ACYC46_07355 [Acidobacteriaceae bacterium]